MVLTLVSPLYRVDIGDTHTARHEKAVNVNGKISMSKGKFKKFANESK